VRRVLDEPELAVRLRAGGLRTAADFAWDAVIGGLEDLLCAARATWSPPELTDGWEFDLRDLRFSEADVEERLRRRAAATTARELAIPVSFPAFEGHRVVRWRTVGRRRGGADGVARVVLTATADRPPRDLPYADALRAFTAERFESALAQFLAAYQRADNAEQASLGRWIVLTLLELGRDDEATSLVANCVQTFPDYSDYHYLQAVTAMVAGRPIDGEAYVAALATLGPATHHAEWFDAPAHLALERLVPGAT
jgi:hypothetical protein